MFSKKSRYRKLPDVVAADAGGRTLASKSVRLPPDVTGEFLHTVEEVDRLDHLAHKYYKQPRKWWRICDANSEFLHPDDVLGKGPVKTVRFSLSWDDEEPPPWPELRRLLFDKVGVLDVGFVEEVILVPEERMDGADPITVHLETFERAVVVTYNRMNILPGDLSDAVSRSGFSPGQPEEIERIGKKIIIPRNIV